MEPPGLYNLPACIIRDLLSYLDATTLYNLAKSDERMGEIIKEHNALWKRIDARRAPNTGEKLEYCLERIWDNTHSLLLRADNPREILIPKSVFEGKLFEKLTILSLENQTIDGELTSVTCMPQHLEELSLKRTRLANSLRFFRNSWGHMLKLRVLILDCSSWVTNGLFMSICKYERLEILSLYQCVNCEDSIAYLSISGHLGFKKLRVFDARLCPFGYTLLRSVHRFQTLLAVYLQNRDLSYKLDFYKRRLAISEGAPVFDYYTEDRDLDFGKEDLEPPYRGEQEYADSDFLNDQGLLDFLSTFGYKTDLLYPQSVLYRDPYGKTCNCDHEGGPPEVPDMVGSTGSDDDDDNDDSTDLTRSKLSKRVKHLQTSLRRTGHRGIRYRGLCEVQRNPSNQFFGAVVSNGTANDNGSLDQRRDGYQGAPEGAGTQRIIDVLTYRPALDNAQAPPENRKRPLPDDNTVENGAKRACLEPQPGPSGLNNNNSPAVEVVRAETPPLVPPEAENDVRFVVELPAPMVTIINLQNAKKTLKVPLRKLSLRGYRNITNRTLHYIENLELELLDLTYTSCTEAGIIEFLSHNPSCRVLHEKFCKCAPNLHF